MTTRDNAQRALSVRIIHAVREIITAIHRLEYGKHVDLHELTRHEKLILNHLTEEEKNVDD